MADGESYDIDINAKTVAVESAASQVAALGKSLQRTSSAAGQFDSAVAKVAKQAEKVQKPIDGASSALKGLGASEKLEKIGKVGEALTTMSGASLVAAAGFALVAVAAVAAVGALGAFAVKSNPGAMLRLNAATANLRKSFAALFTGLKLDKFISALEDVMSIFDEGTSTAAGLKALLETVLQPLFDGAAKAGPYVKEMFKGLVYGALQVAIAVLGARNAIFKAMSPETRAAIKAVSDSIFTMKNAFNVGAGVAIFLAVTVGVLAIAMGVLAVAFVIAMLPILAVVASIALVVAAFVYFDEIIDGVGETLSGWASAAKDAAKNMITGLVNGIKAGAGAVWDAMKGLAGGAVSAFKNTLGIKSPSTVFALQGAYSAAGYVEGIEDSAPKVNNALESMVSPPDVQSAMAGKALPSSSTSTQKTLTIGQITITAPAGDAESIATAVRRVLIETFEGVALSTGAVST